MSDALDRVRARSAMRDLERDDLSLEGDGEEVLRDWEPDVTYQPGQLVYYDHTVYRAAVESTGANPRLSTSWMRATDLIDGD